MTLFVRRVFGRTPGTRGRTGLRQCGQWRAGTRTRRRNAGSGWQSTRSRTSSAPPGKSASAPPQQGRVSGADALRATVRAGTNIFGEPGCVLFRRDLLELEGGWDSTWPYLIDQATYARILMHGDMVALRMPLASFRISAGQWSVRLAGQHAGQSMAFHKWLQQAHPGLLSVGDVVLGNMRTMALGIARRAAYFWLRRRM